MAFNWAGAAAGANDGLQQAIKNRLLEAESAQRQQQIEETAEYRRLQQQVAQQNAESLADSRQARIDEKAAAAARRKGLVETAKSYLANPDAIDVSAYEPEVGQRIKQFEIAAAQHVLRTGEDVPDSLRSQFYASVLNAPKQQPSKLLTPDEESQQVRLAEAKAKVAAKYRAPSATSTNKAERREADIAVQNYLGYLKRKHKSADAALEEFDTSGDAIRKGSGLADVNAYRKLLERMYGVNRTPKQQYEDKIYGRINDQFGAGERPDPEDDEVR